MEILILGAGQVGTELSELLTNDGHNITIVDTEADRLQKASSHIDLKTVEGNASYPKVLEQAYINNIDVESRLLNIDYNNQKCGKKNFKNTDSKALKCFNDNLLKNDSLNITNSTIYKHNPKNNRQCKTASKPIFNQSSKRITNLDW